MRKLSIILITLFIVLMLIFISPQAVKGDDTLYDVYEGPMGIEIKSYTSNWTGEKLKDIYEELLNNTYGEEIKYLASINLYPDNPYGGDEEGLYRGAYQRNNFINKSRYKMKDKAEIDLLSMKDKNTIEEIAKTLSHEYGHHFTLYYLIKGENKTFDQWQDTQYAAIRGLVEDERVSNDYENGHQWNISEIAAEDYIQIFGSPTAKIPKTYDDIIKREEKKQLDQTIRWNNHIFNVYPQENFNIPLAQDIPGVADYWRELAGLEDLEIHPIPSTSHIALTQVKDLGYNKKQFIIEWTEGIDAKTSPLLYTVVAFDEHNQQAIPIKTVKTGEKLQAVIGSVKMKKGLEILYYTDHFTETPKDIRVFTMNEYGNIVSSNILTIDFEQPMVTELNHEEYTPQEKDMRVQENIRILQDKESIKKWVDKAIEGFSRTLEGIKLYIKKELNLWYKEQNY
ncbi:hypothetical protein NSA47_06910 [Irregularibacter muris]|uniref:Uncharacterized protein n=1 Tax=Irregularibacter muris TaxID=1796619 RepID=A0AAE3HEN8_9FIRM|nr:hypothetical protein [Irregularibacter muris]MCR1898721.1 hypothetical protein [Irregularibacter muris]